MSINNATPQDWDKVAATGEPTFESYMERLNSQTVFDGTKPAPQAAFLDDIEEFAGCWKLELENDEWSEGRVDPVNAPAHYNAGSIECIEAIEESMSGDAFRGYLKGNCMKYLWRYSYKGKSLEDVQKAKWYLDRLVGALGG
tara:strand:- start:300 stop:725 length:426 start_codon:yes stop_codon:yes gene_type:complete